MKKSIKIGVLLLAITGVISGCATKELPAQDNPAIVGGYTSQITFNYVSEGVSYLNPKVRSIVYVSKQNPSAVAIIRFNDINAKDWSLNLEKTLNKEGVKTKVIGYANKEKRSEVSVYINFEPLDKVLDNQEKNKLKDDPNTLLLPDSQGESMVNITNIIN